MQNPRNGMIKSKARIIKESWNRLPRPVLTIQKEETCLKFSEPRLKLVGCKFSSPLLFRRRREKGVLRELPACTQFYAGFSG